MTEKSLDESQQTFLQSFNEINAVLRAIAQPKRFKILILLLTNPHTFHELLDKVKLRKTALANHLTYLQNKSLVEKIQHGTYKITQDGQTYLRAIEAAYNVSEARKQKIKESQLKYQLSKTFIERKKDKKQLESEQQYSLSKTFLERKRTGKEGEE